MLNKPYGREGPASRRHRLRHLCDLGFAFYEEIYKHHVRYKLLDTEDWGQWQQDMAHFFRKPYVRGYWPTVAGRHDRSFQAFANDLLAKPEPE
jgi:hypothetical protein